MALAGIAFLPALAIGSFLNVIAARVPLRRSIASPGSACMSCGTAIRWYDNVPVVSWLVLRGRCRACGSSISWRYPAVELATALLAAACFWTYGASFEALLASFYCAVLVVLSSIDLERRIVPNRIVLPAAAVVLVGQTLIHPSPVWLLGGLGGALFLFLAALAYPGGMGMGDVKLALLLGFMVGKSIPVALFVGMIAALVPSVVLIARHGSAARKMGIPFAPFLAVGGIVALFAGPALLHAYASLLH